MKVAPCPCAPSIPLGHLPRCAGEDLAYPNTSSRKVRVAAWDRRAAGSL
jgi:hypothetical protein